MSLKNFTNELITNPKVASAVSGATISSGISTAMDWIPDDIGKLATLVGIFLSVVLIYTHLRKGILEIKKIKLEITKIKNSTDRQDL